MRPAACTGPPPSDVAARYQKVRGKAIHSSAGPRSNEDTFKWLQAAYNDRAGWMGYLAVDPIFDR
jgi:hypothetical protein